MRPVTSIVIVSDRSEPISKAFIDDIAAALEAQGHSYELLLVSDPGQPATHDKILQLATGDPATRVLEVAEHTDLSQAYVQGLRAARGELLVSVGTSVRRPGDTVRHLLGTMREGDEEAELVVGKRHLSGGQRPGHNALLRWLHHRALRLMHGPAGGIDDPTSDVLALRRDVLERAPLLRPIGHATALELLVRCGCRRVRQIPVTIRNDAWWQHLDGGDRIAYLRHLKRLTDYKYGAFSQLIQFGMVGATGMVVDLTAYALLLRGGIPLELAGAAAIWIAMSWNFLLNRYLTFSYSRNDEILSQYLRFCATCSLGGVISWSVRVGLPHLVPFFERFLLLAALLGIVAGTASNFLISRYWVFTRRVPSHMEDDDDRANRSGEAG